MEGEYRAEKWEPVFCIGDATAKEEWRMPGSVADGVGRRSFLVGQALSRLNWIDVDRRGWRTGHCAL